MVLKSTGNVLAPIRAMQFHELFKSRHEDVVSNDITHDKKRTAVKKAKKIGRPRVINLPSKTKPTPLFQGTKECVKEEPDLVLQLKGIYMVPASSQQMHEKAAYERGVLLKKTESLDETTYTVRQQQFLFRTNSI